MGRRVQPLLLIAASIAGDGALAATYLATWIEPDGRWARPIGNLMLVMLLEFVIIHSAAFMGRTWTTRATLAARTKTMLGFGVFYLLFAAAWAASFGVWWPVIAFLVLVLNRLVSMFYDPDPSEVTREAHERQWAMATVFYLAFASATTFLPIPRFGINEAARLAADLPGSGLWISQPHQVIAFGFLYFAATATAATRRRWRAVQEARSVAADPG